MTKKSKTDHGLWSWFKEELLICHVQPIVDLKSGKALGYESLIRVDHTPPISPLELFAKAEEAGGVEKLSATCRNLGLALAEKIEPHQMLFINIHPSELSTSDFLEPGRYPPSILKHSKRIVFEVTERAAIKDLTSLKARMGPLRKAGFRVAVDDLGSGYATLETVAEMAPEFVKLDISLVRGIAESHIKQALVRNLLRFLEEVGAHPVAEGIETKAQLHTLVSLGCHSGQGYLFAAPALPFPQVHFPG